MRKSDRITQTNLRILLKQKVQNLFFSLRTKITITAILALLFVTTLSNFFICKFSVDSQFQQLRHQMMIVAQIASLLVEGDALTRVPLNREEGVASPEYKMIFGQFQKIKVLDPTIKYIYTLRKTDKPDVWQFVVDADPELPQGIKQRVKKNFTAYPGDPYFVGRFPEITGALAVPTADLQITSDEWGTTLSSYAPVKDASGNAVAVLGVDMDARDVHSVQKSIWRAAIGVFLTGILLSVALGVILGGQMTRRLKKLMEGTRRLSTGDLEYRVSIKGHDEVMELSESLNQMACSLSDSRKKLAEYFFRMVQSLICMLEAKDKYTQGHSQRVGDYAYKITIKMGFSKEQAELLKMAGELHDIGKLAIPEHILGKQGKLTEEEMEVIRQHPIIGAEALKPVCFDEIIMASVYSHHERYDGGGYPQKIRGDQTSIFAQIISVVDAYDAMTTNRPYRNSLGKEVAINELKKHSGTQFNPAVVEAFIGVVNEP